MRKKLDDEVGEYHAGRTPKIERLEEQIQNAQKNRMPLEYFRACVELGLPESGIADKELFEEGRGLESSLNFAKNNKRLKEKEKKQKTEKDKEKDWREIACISLTRFSELQKGDRVTVPEIKNRLRKLRDAGYEIQAYSRMKATELWGYMMKIQRDVYLKAKQYCPDTLKEIQTSNEKAKSRNS